VLPKINYKGNIMGVGISAYFGLYLSVTLTQNYKDVIKFNEHTGEKYTKSVPDGVRKTFAGTDIAVVPEIGLTAEIEDDVYVNMLPSMENQYFGVTINSLGANYNDAVRVFDDIATDMATAQTKLMLLLIKIYSKDDAQTLAENAKFMHVMCYN
jgi:hypothetical protein